MSFPPSPSVGAHFVFHHFGLAVRRREEAAAFVEAMGYQVGDSVFDPEQNVNLTMCFHPSAPAIEIIWPGDSKGPIDRLVERFSTGIVYHLCYSTENLSAALGYLDSRGLRVSCISPPKPAPLFGGRKVSFYHIVGTGLIEVLEPAESSRLDSSR